MTSPRLMSLKGSIRSRIEPRAPKANLLTSRWSPTRRLSSIDGVGILNAWTINVVPKSARMTVITSDSKYSRAVDFLKAASTIFCQRLRWFFVAGPDPLQRVPRGRLLCCFLRQAGPMSHGFAINHNLNSKQLLVIRSLFTCHSVFGTPEMTRLQLLLKLGLKVRQLP